MQYKENTWSSHHGYKTCQESAVQPRSQGLSKGREKEKPWEQGLRAALDRKNSASDWKPWDFSRRKKL